MVKHTQTIHRLFVEVLFEFVWPFCGVETDIKICLKRNINVGQFNQSTEI